MPKSSVHSKIANEELRDQYGKFVSPVSPSLTPPNNPPTSPNPLNSLIKSLSKLSFKKITTIAAFIYLVGTNSIVQNIVEYFYPYSSPILHRVVAHQGTLQTSGNGMYSLKLADGSVYALELKPTPTLTSLKHLREVVVKGNLTLKPYVITNAEIYPVNISTP